MIAAAWGRNRFDPAVIADVRGEFGAVQWDQVVDWLQNHRVNLFPAAIVPWQWRPRFKGKFYLSASVQEDLLGMNDNGVNNRIMQGFLQRAREIN